MACALVRRDNPGFNKWIIDRTNGQTMLYLTCTMLSRVYLAHYGVCRAKAGPAQEVGEREKAPNFGVNYFKVMQFFTRNRIYTPNFGPQIKIFLRFAHPLQNT